MAARSQSISPPPSKRRRLSSSPSTPTINTTVSVPSIPSLPLRPIQPNHLRIFTWNINGITPFLQQSITNFFSSLKSSEPHLSNQKPSILLRSCLKRWKWPQVVCLQEVKISPKDIKTQAAVSTAVKAPTSSFEPSYMAYFSLPHDKYNAQGFGGKVHGVCTLIRSDLIASQYINVVGDIKSVDWDLEGRVLALELSVLKLVILNVYAVNGTSNPYRSPATGEVIGTRHDRKRAFHAELRDECARYLAKGWNVVVAGDINIARAEIDAWPKLRLGAEHVVNRRDFEEKFMLDKEKNGLGMTDSFRALRGQERKFSWRPTGRIWGHEADRVDLILVDKGLRGDERGERELIEADILDEEAERGESDHVPSYITLQMRDMTENGTIIRE